MVRLTSALGAVAIAAALAVTLVAPAAPDGVGRPEIPTRPGREAPTAGATGGYAMPIVGDVLTPFEDPAVPWAPGHRGVDVLGAAGAPVHAAAEGVVAFVGVVVDRPVLAIQHPDGIRTTYEPVAAVVAVGDAVTQGQVIGTLVAQASHCAPAACLHWGAKLGDDYLDPLSLLAEPVIRLYPSGQRGPPLTPAGEPAGTRPGGARS